MCLHDYDLCDFKTFLRIECFELINFVFIFIICMYINTNFCQKESYFQLSHSYYNYYLK